MSIFVGFELLKLEFRMEEMFWYVINFSRSARSRVYSRNLVLICEVVSVDLMFFFHKCMVYVVI